MSKPKTKIKGQAQRESGLLCMVSLVIYTGMHIEEPR